MVLREEAMPALPALERYKQGPFPEQIDPWAEAVHEFEALHNEMISALLALLDAPLLAKGYIIGRETSLQIAEGREPDVFLYRRDLPSTARWDYALAAEEALAPAGVPVMEPADLDALHIRNQTTGDLVTVLEVVSPGNKTRPQDILAYQERRTRLYLERGIQVVKCDFTRSIRRLSQNRETAAYPYHCAVYLPSDARVIGIGWGERLPRLALPLRGEVVAVELHEAYTRAYRATNIAWHIQHDGRYREADLPFPSLLTDDAQRTLLETVERWQATLQADRSE
jgi:hypothetical protein